MHAPMIVNRDVAPLPTMPIARFAVVREMLGDLDNISVAGQQHVMAKIIRFIEAESNPDVRRMRARNRLALSELVAGLRHEAARLSPDVARFVRGAEAVSVLLTAMA